jgi:hypothetical protein
MEALPIVKRRCGICGLADHATGNCPIAVIGKTDNRDGRCVGCDFWTRNENDVMGECSCEKMVYDPLGLCEVRDALVYFDRAGDEAHLVTGDWFGCVHWRTSNGEQGSISGARTLGDVRMSAGRFHLFAYESRYPMGGMSDYKGSFDTLNKAMNHAESLSADDSEGGSIAQEQGGALVSVATFSRNYAPNQDGTMRPPCMRKIEWRIDK